MKSVGSKGVGLAVALMLVPIGGAEASAADPAELRIVEYLQAHVAPGQRVVVSELYNEVFTTPEERAVLDRLFNTFFKIPLFVAQFSEASGRPPTLAELSGQFRFEIPGEANVILKIMESDPRMPPFLERDKATGEIVRVDVDAIQAHPHFGKLLERSLSGWVGRPVPAFALKAYDGSTLSAADLAGKGYLVYFWFTGCPPCVETTPKLVELYAEFAPRGFEIVAVNADVLLELPYTDEQRARYVSEMKIRFKTTHATADAQAAFGAVSVFPTMFFVDREGTIVAQHVSAQSREVLVAAIEKTLDGATIVD
jgi:thiol-disulfide isomerase/thioredoxin